MYALILATALGQFVNVPQNVADRWVEQSYGVNVGKAKSYSFIRGPMDWPGYTGVVTKVDPARRLIFTTLATEKVAFHYNPKTRFRTISGNFKILSPGDMINVDMDVVTIIDGTLR
jgi:hypothetical protein